MKIIVSYSGGLDSTVLLWYLVSQGHNVRALSVIYGQRHVKELDSAVKVCKHPALPYGIDHQYADLFGLRKFLKGSSQTDLTVDVPEGHYAEESMKKTVVPNRNMLLLAVAGAWAVSNGADAIAYAAHTGDHAIYPDCRPEFTAAMAAAFQLCDFNPIRLLRPFLEPTPMSKADIVKLGCQIGAPMGLSWSCYKGNEKHCGKCGTCVERKEAFQLANVVDPTEYEA